MKLTATLVGLMLAIPVAALPAKAITPEQSSDCHRGLTSAAIYNKMYQRVPAFACFDPDGTITFILDVSNYTSNSFALTYMHIPVPAERVFVRYQGGRVVNETSIWSSDTAADYF